MTPELAKRLLLKAGQIQQAIDTLVLCCPTSIARNNISEANLQMMDAIEELRKEARRVG